MPKQPPIQWSSVSFPGVKPPGREADYTPPSRTQVKNEWRNASIPVYAFKAWKGQLYLYVYFGPNDF